MSVKDYEKVAIISNCYNGDIVEVLKLKNHTSKRIAEYIADLIEWDLDHEKYGLQIKFGIEP